MAMLPPHHRPTALTFGWRARSWKKDWERAGDYLRAGLDGREFYQSPKPRWESLHDFAGTRGKLWRINRLKQNIGTLSNIIWRSILRWDRRKHGRLQFRRASHWKIHLPLQLSKTCCTVAWMALTIDYLRLTGDPQARGRIGTRDI